MIPIHLYLFNIESLTHFVWSVLLCVATLVLSALISLLVFEIKRRRGSLTLSTWVLIKHRMILLGVVLTSLLFLQTYLAVGVIALYLWKASPFFEPDFRILSLEDYPTWQRPAERRRNQVAIELAKQVQQSEKSEDPHAFMARYHGTCDEITASDASIFANKRKFSRPDFLLPVALFGSLAGAVKIVAFFPIEVIAYSTASGFPLIFLMVNAILTATVIFFGLIYGNIQWEWSATPSIQTAKLNMALILFYVCIVLIILAATFGWT